MLTRHLSASLAEKNSAQSGIAGQNILSSSEVVHFSQENSSQASDNSFPEVEFVALQPSVSVAAPKPVGRKKKSKVSFHRDVMDHDIS